MPSRLSAVSPSTFTAPESENAPAAAPRAPEPAPFAAPSAALAPAVVLSSPLFRSDDTLEQVAAGQLQLGTGATGQAVERMQRALLAAGCPLPRFGADGDFGAETRAALEQFQTRAGLEPTGTLDAATLGALDAKGGAAATRYPEYGELFKDGVLDATIAIGFDEDGSDLSEGPQVRAGLAQRGFEPLDVAHLSDAALRGLGLDPSKLDREATYYAKLFVADGRPVRALVKLIDRDSPQAKEQFARAMSNAEVVVYSGHARYGTGPDFDRIDSPDGNFVIGQTYAPGHVVFGANDLAKTHLSDGYQLMFFDACRTKDYLDDLRSIPRNKNAGNLDLVVSDQPVYWSDGTANVFAALDGVMGRQSIDELQSGFERINHVGFTADGFNGNRYRPA